MHSSFTSRAVRRNVVALANVLVWPALLASSLWLTAGQRIAKQPAASQPAASQPAAPTLAKVTASYQAQPLRFEANRGQAATEFDFLARGPQFNLALSASSAVFALAQPDLAAATLKQTANAALHPRNRARENRAPGKHARVLELLKTSLRQATTPERQPQTPASAAPSAAATVRLTLVNANPRAKATGLETLPGKINYLRGDDPARWQPDVPTFARVKFAEVYPGVDVVYYGQQRSLEYDFVVAPHADPTAIRLRFSGAERLQLEATGALVLACGKQSLRMEPPVAYQLTDGQRQLIPSRYERNDAGEISFRLGAYDASRALVIDPVLSYATYLGSTARSLDEEIDFGDFSSAIAVDTAGNAYVTGLTFGNDFPTLNPVQKAAGGGVCAESACTDIFVAKFSPTGTLLYSTYLGGSGAELGNAIAVDATGNAYITGQGDSANFPAGRPANRGNDALLIKLSADGSRILYNYALGGTGSETGTGIAVDAAGNAYVTGTTFAINGANDFPIANPLQRNPGSTGNCSVEGQTVPCTDAFFAKLSANGTTLEFSSYLGGSGLEIGGSIAVDAQNRVYLSGSTSSSNFPKTANAYQGNLATGACSEPNFCFDGFLTRLTADGTALSYSTYVGGNDLDFVQGLAVDGAGNMLLSGTTLSPDFPLKNSLKEIAFFITAFATKFDANGALVYSTLLGGSVFENLLHFALAPSSIFGGLFQPHLIATDAAGNAYVTGMTNSPDFPTLNAVQSQPGGGNCDVDGQPVPCPDAFVTKLNPSGALLYSTYLGGQGAGGLLDQALLEGGFSIAADAAGTAYVVGVTSSNSFPTANPAQAARRGNADVFVAKITDGLAPNAVASVNAASFQGPTLAAESIVAAFGTNLAPRTETATTTPLPTTLAGVTVRVRDANNVERAAPLFFVSAGQINYLLPLGTANGTAQVTVSNGTTTLAAGAVRVVTTAPGLFAADASGQGLAATVVLRVRADGSQVFENAVRFDAATNRFVAVPIDLGPATEQVFLLLFGSGFRNSATTTASIGGTNAPVSFAGATTLAGLDQANVRIPRELAGRGDANINLTANGAVSNTVRVNIR